MTTPPHPPPAVPQAPTGQKNGLGTIAMIAAVVGSVLACIPASLTVGWIVLAAALIMGFVGLLQSGKTKKLSIAAIVVSIVGAVVSATIVLLTVGDLLFRTVFGGILNLRP
jgi:hypothetical protein